MWFFRGLMIAAIFGLPAGAIGALTIHRTLKSGFRSGLMTGLGSTAADVLYASIGVFGITLISDYLTAHQQIIGSVGGVMILVIGLCMILKKENVAVTPMPGAANGWKAFLTSFALAIVNPAAVISFFSALAAFGITEISEPDSAALLVIGIGTGTIGWWVSLAGLTVWLKKKISISLIHRCSRLLGTVMMLFGLYTIIRFMNV